MTGVAWRANGKRGRLPARTSRARAEPNVRRGQRPWSGQQSATAAPLRHPSDSSFGPAEQPCASVWASGAVGGRTGCCEPGHFGHAASRRSAAERTAPLLRPSRSGCRRAACRATATTVRPPCQSAAPARAKAPRPAAGWAGLRVESREIGGVGPGLRAAPQAPIWDLSGSAARTDRVAQLGAWRGCPRRPEWRAEAPPRRHLHRLGRLLCSRLSSGSK